MREQDSLAFQVARLKKLLAERAPGTEISFDDSNTMVRFGIRHVATGTVLMASSGEWLPSEIADKSDDELWKLIQHLSSGRL